MKIHRLEAPSCSIRYYSVRFFSDSEIVIHYNQVNNNKIRILLYNQTFAKSEDVDAM